MLYSSLLFMIPIVICAPIQQWTINNNQQPDQTSMMNLMIHDDIQTHYETMVDEIISTHSEDILFQLANSMNDRQSLEQLLQPQAIALLGYPVQETCLKRMPSMIAKHLHDLHTKVLDTIEPVTFPQEQETDLIQQLSLLNIAMDQKVMEIVQDEDWEHKLTLDLSACEQAIHPPVRSLWLLLKDFWKESAGVSDQTVETNGEPTLLQSYLESVADNLHTEFKLRLVDLYRTLRTDVYDENLAI
ncbi:hypothetical protein BC941DRAFT_473892 [Chlamydoabsidia padenii]|nr:hypothetical protein BC941DRAFT_473892 [Chlamydoabsidia padenii]